MKVEGQRTKTANNFIQFLQIIFVELEDFCTFATTLRR